MYRETESEATLGLFDRIFNRRKPPQLTELVVTGRSGGFASHGGDPWANDVYRAGVDAIARIAAKFVLQPTVTFSDGTSSPCDDRLSHLLQVKPNRYQTSYDFLYQLFSALYVKNNSYAYIQRNAIGQVVGLYPLHVAQVRHFEDSTGTLFSAFTFSNGRSFCCPYSDVIHLRRHLNGKDLDGDSNSPIDAGISLAESMNRGIEASIRTAGQLKGIVKVPGSVSQTKLAELKAEFEATYLSPANAGGVVTSDATFEYVPFDTKEPPAITSEDQRTVANKIYNYLGIGESIVNGTFTDEQFSAFEESTIEGLALQLSLELSSKIYGDRHGRRIDVSTSRIRFIGQQHKTELLKHLLPMGLMSLNEGRDLLGMPPIESGDRRIQSLNYIDAEIANRYQLVRSGQGIKALATEEEADDEQ